MQIDRYIRTDINALYFLHEHSLTFDLLIGLNNRVLVDLTFSNLPVEKFIEILASDVALESSR